jgi:hypothetical protein
VTSESSGKAGWGGRALKAIGVVTAVVSLVLGVHQVVTRVGGYWQQTREARTLTEMARQQAARSEFTQAWSSLDRAAAAADSDAVAAARLEIAFAWLQEGRPGPGRPFSTITDTVTPALDQALVKAEGQRRADIIAHLGWATFLRLRDGVSGDPAARYQEALALDPGNPYANAMLGHWLMWRGGNPQTARERFETALARGGPSRPFVRQFQIAALMNRIGDSDTELLRVANSMREQGEPLHSRAAGYVYSLYMRRYGPNAGTRRATEDTLPPATSLAVYEWVLTMDDESDRAVAVNAYIRSALQEKAGDRAAALATLRALQEREPLASPLREQVQQAVTRLSTAR